MIQNLRWKLGDLPTQTRVADSPLEYFKTDTQHAAACIEQELQFVLLEGGGGSDGGDGGEGGGESGEEGEGEGDDEGESGVSSAPYGHPRYLGFEERRLEKMAAGTTTAVHVENLYHDNKKSGGGGGDPMLS